MGAENKIWSAGSESEKEAKNILGADLMHFSPDFQLSLDAFLLFCSSLMDINQILIPNILTWKHPYHHYHYQNAMGSGIIVRFQLK